MKFRKDKAYQIDWLDHCTCYYSWISPDDMNTEDYSCQSIGYFVKETKTSIFLAQNKAKENGKYSNMMQILKSTITKTKVIV